MTIYLSGFRSHTHISGITFFFAAHSQQIYVYSFLWRLSESSLSAPKMCVYLFSFSLSLILPLPLSLSCLFSGLFLLSLLFFSSVHSGRFQQQQHSNFVFYVCVSWISKQELGAGGAFVCVGSHGGLFFIILHLFFIQRIHGCSIF